MFWGFLGMAQSACAELALLLVPVSWCDGSAGFRTGDGRAVQTCLAVSSPAGDRGGEAAVIWSNADHQAEPLLRIHVPAVCRQELPCALWLACGANVRLSTSGHTEV